MNTNNAPERIELPNGCYLSLIRSPMGNPLWYDLMAGDDTVLFRGNGSTSGIKEQIAFAAAMQPQVSDGDEAVAREICKTPCVKYGDGQYGFVYADVLSVLKRHRQPTAVSADAVKLAKYFATSWLSLSEKDITGRIQAYGEACRLDGARRMQEAAANISETWLDADVRIRALSPETVCGGE